jgi:hypothetical protein
VTSTVVSVRCSQHALMHQWETIQKCVNKFCGCLKPIELRRQSGTTMKDMVISCFHYHVLFEYPFGSHKWNTLTNLHENVLCTSPRTNIKNNVNPSIVGIS